MQNLDVVEGNFNFFEVVEVNLEDVLKHFLRNLGLGNTKGFQLGVSKEVQGT